MVIRIAFPTPVSVDIRSYPDMSAAEASISEIATGTVYVLSEITLTTLRAMTLPQMVVIYNSAQKPKNRVKKLGSKKDAAQRILHLIPEIAQEAIMATKKAKTTPKKAPAKSTKKAPAKATTKAPAKAKAAAGRSGRTSDLIGKKITKTGKRDSSGAHSGSRRSASYALIKNGMKYEKALELGVHKDDIAKLIFEDHIRLA